MGVSIKDKQPYFYLYGILFCAMFWWLLAASTQSINTDIVYLTQSAIYFLSGEKMIDAYYDNNPPLCILAYVIPAALVKYLGIPITSATFGYNFSLVMFSALLVFLALKPIAFIKNSDKHIITILYVLTNTVAANLYMGEKDQFIILGLFPFILLQIIITYDYKISAILKAVILTLGTVFIMIKPHFYIIPALFILHRLAKKKTLACVFQSDSIALCIGAILYAIALATYFKDYTTLILPDALILYSVMKEPWVLNLSALMAFITGIAMFCAYFLPQKPYTFPSLLLLLSALCLIPFALQGKGYYYHLLPALTFFACGSGLAFTQAIRDAISKQSKSDFQKYELPLILFTSLLFYGGYYALFYTTHSVLSHAEYKNSPLAKVINACPQPPCSYFMFNDTTEISQQLSAYTGRPHASRLASFWFLPVLLSPNSPFTTEKKQELSEKYSAIVAEDFKKFKPDTLILGQFHINTADPEIFHFINFFTEHSPEFAQQIKNYAFEQTLDINLNLYFPETIMADRIVKFDIYRRNNPQNPQ